MAHRYDERAFAHNETLRKISQGAARICRCRFGAAWKGLYPFKAAEELAHRTGCSLRTASYQLSGEHEPSARSICALVNECMRMD